MEFGLLGPVRVHDGAGDRPIPAAKQRIVLAALLLHDGAIVSVDELIDLVWNGTPPDGAVIALRNHVMRLRRTLGPLAGARIRTRTPGYLIEIGDGELDTREFTALRGRGVAAARAGDVAGARQALRAALALWRGQPLLDVESDRLQSADGSRLAELRLETLRERVDADLRAGEHELLVSELRRLTHDHPLREAFHGQLMLALYRAGRQAEALAAFRDARSVLIDTIGVEPGPELETLHRRILTMDAALDAPAAPDSGAAPPDTPTAAAPVAPPPAQLPPDTADFVGRDRQVDAAVATFSARSGDAGTATVIVVTGTGGVGKSTFASRVAHQVRHRFPDGQLHVNLRGATADPLTSAEASARILRDMGTDPAGVPDDDDERDNLYRSVLSRRRVLIVLDDARETAQVRRLLPGSASCGVLITSRDPLGTLPATRRIALDGFTPDESYALLARIIGPDRAGAESAAVAEVGQACSGLPLAIRIASARLLEHPHDSVRALAGRLADARTRLDVLAADDLAVRATFTLSYDRLSEQPAAARAFRALGLWPGTDIGIAAAAALFGESPQRAGQLLDSLCAAQLLHCSAPGRFRPHDLLHAYALERAQHEDSEIERRAATDRLLSWHAHSIHHADRTLRPHRVLVAIDPPAPGTAPVEFAGYRQALDWCEAEHAGHLAAVRLAATTGRHDLAWRIALSSWSYYYTAKRYDDWIAATTVGLASARTLGDRTAEGALLASLGTALCESGRRPEAIGRYEQALTLHRLAGDADREPSTLNSLAAAYGEMGEFSRALSTFDRARAAHQRNGNRQGEALALSNMALCHAELGRTAESINHNEQALRIFRHVGDRYSEGISLGNLGGAYAKSGAHEQAIEWYTAAITAHQEAGNQHGIARCQAGTARSREALGQHHAAVTAWQDAAAGFAALGQASRAEALEASAALTRLAAVDAA